MTLEKRKAIGYMRVSTPGQATNGQGLDRQERRIREAAERFGLEVIAIYQDVGTAGGPFSHLQRGDLQTALRVARMHDMPLVVSELSRLTREPSRVDDVLLLEGVQIISAKAEETVSETTMRKVIERAHRSRVNISTGTAAGHARRKAKGEVSGNVEALELARASSLASRRARASETVDLVATILENHPEYLGKTAAELAQLLTDRGILSGWGRPFTTESVRRVLRAAKKTLENRQISNAKEDLTTRSRVLSQPVPATTGDLDGSD